MNDANLQCVAEYEHNGKKWALDLYAESPEDALELFTMERYMKTQPDQVKETRMQLARMCEATDRELLAFALAFCEWGATRLKPDDTLKPIVRCTGVSSE